MTQPNGPGIVFNERGPAQFNSLEASRGAPNPLAPPPVAQPAAATNAAPGEEPAELTPEQALGYETPVDPAQAELEERHTKGETFANQFTRGALSALLAPAALGAAQTELYGKVLGIKALEDFGRSFGRASTGRSALEAGQAVAALLSGEEDVTGIADQARIAVDEQEKAWPLLSTAAQIGGGVALGLATGAASSGASEIGAQGLAALGAYEGAATGAQAAYDVDAPLTEVWTSAIVGGTIGAGLSQAPALVGKAASKIRGGLEKVFTGGEMLGEFGEGRVAKSLGFGKKAYKKYGEEEVAQVARDIDELHLADGTPVFPKNVMEAATLDRSDIAERLVQAHQEVGAEIGQLRARASAFIDQSMPQLRPNPAMIASRLETEVAAPLAASVSEADRAASRYIQKTAQNLSELGDATSLERMVAERQRIGAELGDKFQSTGAQIDAMKRVYGIMQDDLAARFEMAAERMGESAAYRPLNRKYTSIERALEAMEDGVAGQKGNNFLGLSSNIVMAGTLASDLASGGGFSAIKALGYGLGHKLVMEKGPQIMAVLARKFSRTPAAVDVATVGGREAQEAMTEIVRAKKFIQSAADAAGPNPQVGAVAGNTAEEVVHRELAKRAGAFNPTEWATAAKAPSPLARVLYRSPILDTVSNDLAQTVEKSAALRPSLDFEVNPAKLAKLTKDADGPQAIGLVQQRVRGLADSYTPLAQGIDEAFGQQAPDVIHAARLMPVLEGSLARLETADVAGAMAEAHNLSRLLTASGAETDGRSLALMLGDDSFGRAGKLYQQMTAAPSDTLKELANPTKLRDALRTLELRGELSQQITAEHASTLAAYEARKALTGEPVPPDIKKQMQAIEQLWARGEESVTLDGTRLGRIVDALENTTESKVASKVPAVPEQQQVQEAVKGALAHIEPVVRGSRTGRAIALGAIKAAAQLTPKERFAQYERRLETLAQATVQPDTDERTAAINQAPAGARVAVTQAASQKVATLLKDMPKPKTDIHGTAYDSLSSEDIRLGNAMWEATMEPMSVFQDFARGDLDPDKVAYAWKQYPGLQKVAQLGVLDILQSQLTPEERSAVPDSVLTQLDFMLGFNGGLQGSVSFEFSQRMSQAFEAQKQDSATPSPPSRGLSLPTSKPTMTQRLAGAQ